MRTADATRLDILKKAYDLIYLCGYQATSLDDILSTTSVTKGAFYYHFKNKEEMGIAIINEILKPRFLNHISRIFNNESDPLAALYKMVNSLLADNDFLKLEQGCPLANLIQEMSGCNLNFSKVLFEITTLWLNKITDVLEMGKVNGHIKSDVQAAATAQFIISGYWGMRNFGRLQKGKQVYRPYLKELKSYLNSLQTEPQ